MRTLYLPLSLCGIMFYRAIPLLILVFFAQTIDAQRFAGKALLADVRINSDVVASNENQVDLPLLDAGEVFDIELFLQDGRANRTRDITISFDNRNNQFGEFFQIEGIRGILPEHSQSGPTTATICADFPVTIPVNDYLATITLSVKNDIPPGLILGFNSSRTTVMNEQSWVRDTLDVGNTKIFFGRPDYNLRLDLNTSPGNQGQLDFAGIKPEQEVTVQIFGEGIKFINGYIFRFEYDATQLEFTAFTPGSALPSVQTLDPVNTALDSPFSDVEVTAVSFGQTAQVDDGLLGTLTFLPTEIFVETGIRMTSAEVRRSGEFRPFFAPLLVTLSSLNADFDNDGFVDFRDFILFGERFGSTQGDGRFDPRFDLTPDGVINFSDFVLFTESLTLFTVTVLN